MILDSERIGLMIEEAGPRDDAIAAIIQSGETTWQVHYGECEIDCEYEPTLQRLMLTIPVGVVAPERQARVYETLLAFNLIWRDTGGVRMALAGPNGQVVQMVDLTGAELSTDLLLTVMTNLVEKADIWRDFIAGSQEKSPLESYSAQGFIRI